MNFYRFWEFNAKTAVNLVCFLKSDCTSHHSYPSCMDYCYQLCCPLFVRYYGLKRAISFSTNRESTHLLYDLIPFPLFRHRLTWRDDSSSSLVLRTTMKWIRFFRKQEVNMNNHLLDESVPDSFLFCRHNKCFLSSDIFNDKKNFCNTINNIYNNTPKKKQTLRESSFEFLLVFFSFQLRAL